MSNKIKGLTLEIGGEVTPLNKALGSVNTQSRDLQSELKNVERLLKLDPTNTDLLAQRQKILAESVENTSKKLDTLKEAEKQAQQQFKEGKISEEQYRALQREVIKTEQELKKLDGQLKQVNDKWKDASKAVSDFGEKSTAMGEKLAPVSAAAGALGAGMVGLAVKAGQTADDINTLSKQTGISTEQIQKFQYASELIDVPLETLTGSLSRLTKNMGAAQQGTGDAAKAFKTLGVDITKADGSLRNNQEVFEETIRLLGEIENETQRDAYAMQIFGRSAQDLNPLILGGADALKKLGDEAMAAGLILSQEALDSANEFKDSIAKLKATATGSFAALGAEIATALIPIIESLSEYVGELLEWMRGLDQDTLKVILVVAALVAGLAPLLMIVGQVAMGISFLMSPIGLVILAITALIAIGVLLYKNWDEIILKVQNLAIQIKVKFYEIQNTIREVWTNAKTATVEAWNNIVNTVKETFSSLITSVVAIGRNIVEGLWNGISSMASWLKDKITGFASGIMDGFKSAFGIESPSTVMRDEIGKMLGEGMAIGIEDSLSRVKSAMKKINQSVVNESNPQTSSQGSTGSSIQQVNNFYSPKALDEAEVQEITRREGQRLQILLAGV